MCCGVFVADIILLLIPFYSMNLCGESNKNPSTMEASYWLNQPIRDDIKKIYKMTPSHISHGCLMGFLKNPNHIPTYNGHHQPTRWSPDDLQVFGHGKLIRPWWLNPHQVHPYTQDLGHGSHGSHGSAAQPDSASMLLKTSTRSDEFHQEQGWFFTVFFSWINNLFT